MKTTVRYYTTEDMCSCPDRLYRKRICKHQKALRNAHALIAAQNEHNQAALDPTLPLSDALRKALYGKAGV